MVQRRKACARLRIREYFCYAGPKAAKLFPARPEEATQPEKDTRFLKRLYKCKLKCIAPNSLTKRLPITAGWVNYFLLRCAHRYSETKEIQV